MAGVGSSKYPPGTVAGGQGHSFMHAHVHQAVLHRLDDMLRRQTAARLIGHCCPCQEPGQNVIPSFMTYHYNTTMFTLKSMQVDVGFIIPYFSSTASH